MRLVVKQKILSFLGHYNIYNENDEIIYQVQGKLAWGSLLKIYDPSEYELGYVKQKVLTLLPKFEFYVENGLIGEMKKEFTFFKPQYHLTFNNWSITGDVWGLNYSIIDNASGELVGVVNKKFLSIRDEYTIDIPNDQNSLLVLMIVLAIDIDKASQAANTSATIHNSTN